MSTSLSPHPDVAVLPSLPPSPSLLDEVFSHPRPWSVRLEDFDWQRSRRSSPGSVGSHPKGKGRQTIDEVEEEDEDAEHRMSPHEAYPPMNDEAAETQRVEEVRARPPIPSQISRTPASLLFERHSHIHPERLPSTFHQRTDVLFSFSVTNRHSSVGSLLNENAGNQSESPCTTRLPLPSSPVSPVPPASFSRAGPPSGPP